MSQEIILRKDNRQLVVRTVRVVSAPTPTGNDGYGYIELGSDGAFRPIEDDYLVGGWRVVADIAARNAIPAARRVEGMRVHVVADGETYELVGGIDNTDWQESETLPPTTGVDGNALIEVGSSAQFRALSDAYLTGGWRVVADVTARDAIPSVQRVEGMRVKVQSDEKVYELDGGITNGDWAEVTVGIATESTGDITLAVNGTTGSDTPTSTRPARLTEGDYTSEPFETIQAAVDAVPPIAIAGKVEINVVQAGNYTGFRLDGRAFRGAGAFAADSRPGLVVNGLRGAVTPTTGPQTGTATGGSVHTLVHTGAGWTVDDFKGKFLRLVSGTGSGPVLAIAKNTSDTITFATRVATPPASDTVYEILEPTVIINTAIISTPARGIEIMGCVGSIELSDLWLNIADNGLYANNDGSRITCNNVIGQSSSGNAFALSSCREVVINECSVLAGAPVLTVMQRVDINGLAVVDTGAVTLNDCQSATVDGAHTYSGSNGFELLNSSAELTDCHAEDHTGDGYSLLGGRVVMTRCDASGNGGNGIEVGHDSFAKVLTLTGSGNGVWGAIVNGIEEGGTLVLDDSPTITGTSGDASVDGATALGWVADFGSGGDYAHNIASGSRIVRS